MTVCGITAEYNPFHTGHLHRGAFWAKMPLSCV
mgnify:CR=1 FL=1